jgi:hypothetical protein
MAVPMTAQNHHFLSRGGPCPAAALGLLLMLPGTCLGTFLGLPAKSRHKTAYLDTRICVLLHYEAQKQPGCCTAAEYLLPAHCCCAGQCLYSSLLTSSA